MELTARDLIGGGGLIGVAIGAWALYQRIVEFRRRKRDHTFTEVLPKIHQVYAILNNIKREVGAHRVMILASENGGGVPRVGCQLYTSVVYETFDAPLRALRSRWQRQPLDEQYIKLLTDIVVSGESTFVPSMAEDGILKDLHEAQKLVASRYYRLIEREKEVLYLSCSFLNDADYDTPKAREVLRAGLAQLRQLFETERRL